MLAVGAHVFIAHPDEVAEGTIVAEGTGDYHVTAAVRGADPWVVRVTRGTDAGCEGVFPACVLCHSALAASAVSAMLAAHDRYRERTGKKREGG